MHVEYFFFYSSKLAVYHCVLLEYMHLRFLLFCFSFFFFSSRRRHTRFDCDWSSDVCSSDLLALMLIFIAGNLAAAFAPSYEWLMSARVLTSLTHGTFFGVGAVVATGLVPVDKKASAIALMFSGLTLATLLGVPAGAWIGQMFGWRSAFLAVAAIGVLAFAILAAFVPRDQGRPEVTPLAQELAVLANGQVWLGLGITAFGFAGVFALYTYVEPLLTQVTRMGDSLVALTLLLFGAGLAAGNLLGGKLADRGVMRALVWSIAALMVVLAAGRWAFGNQAVAMAYVIVLGVVAFATVAPMQMRVLDQAGPQGANLVSSLNIAAFNLGNALGAWVGGLARSEERRVGKECRSRWSP